MYWVVLRAPDSELRQRKDYTAVQRMNEKWDSDGLYRKQSKIDNFYNIMFTGQGYISICVCFLKKRNLPPKNRITSWMRLQITCPYFGWMPRGRASRMEVLSLCVLPTSYRPVCRWSFPRWWAERLPSADDSISIWLTMGADRSGGKKTSCLEAVKLVSWWIK